ncbi:MAG: ABC transporter substrate-binding protein [Xanthobacteraceae bacterium]|nr:ABC transporter substrate-binding protein [Xanthobacteraceae bacterium]
MTVLCALLRMIAATCLLMAPAYAQDVRVGAILPMTGDASSYGDWMQKGMSIAVDEINSKWKDRKLVLIIEDSKSNPKDAVTAMNKLLTVDKVPTVMTTLTGVTNALAPIADRNKIVLTTSATLPGITEQSPYLFRNATNLSSEINRLVALTKQKYKRPAVLWANLEWAKWGKTAYVDALAKAGIQVVSDQSFPADSTDLRAQLTRIRAAQPDVVLVLAYKTTGVALKQARELGLDAQFIGTLDFELPEVVGIAKEAADGAIYTKASFDPDQPASAAMRAYATEYRKRFGAAPEVYSATMYDMLHMLADAAGASSEPDKIRDALLKVKDFPGASGVTTFLPNRDVEKPVELKTIKDGKYVPYQP